MSRLALFLTVLLMAAVPCLPGAARAADASTTLAAAELQKVFTDLVQEAAPQAAGDIEVTNFSAVPESLTLPAGRPEFRPLDQAQAAPKSFLGRQTLVVDVLVKGEVQGRLKLSGDLALYGEVVSVTRTLARNSVLAAGDLCRVRRNLSLLGPDLVTDPKLAIGKELTTTLQAGAVLYGRSLKEPTLVKRGDIVTILAVTESLRVTVPGRVVNAGGKGELIKVKNLMSRKEIYAKVIGPDTVQVEM